MFFTGAGSSFHTASSLNYKRVRLFASRSLSVPLHTTEKNVPILKCALFLDFIGFKMAELSFSLIACNINARSSSVL